MNSDLAPFNPADWHEHGVLRRAPVSRPTLGKRLNHAVRAVTVAMTVSTALVPVANLSVEHTGESHPLSAIVRTTSATELAPLDDHDEVDPVVWGKLISLFNRLPRDERSDPAEPEPLI